MTTRSVPKVLFVTYGGGHVAMVIPVVKRLIERGLADPTVLALTIAKAACERAGVAAVGFWDLLPEGDDERRNQALALGAELTSSDAGHPDVDSNESIAYHGLSYLDLMDQFGADGAASRYAERGRAAFRPVATMERAIQKWDPDVVVATNTPRSERASIQAAGRLGIPSVCIVDVFALRSDWIADPGFADKVCVLSGAVRNMFVDRGRPAPDIIVTGNPAFDALETVRNRRREPSSTCNILWASHPEPATHPTDSTIVGEPELFERLTSVLVQAAEANPRWNIVIRPHPTVRDLSVDGPDNLSVVGGDRLEDRLAWADIVVTVASTVGVQAALAGIPVVAVSGSVLSGDVPLAEYGLAYGVSVDELSDRLAQLAQDPVALDSGLAPVGGAVDNVIDVILGLARPTTGA